MEGGIPAEIQRSLKSGTTFRWVYAEISDLDNLDSSTLFTGVSDQGRVVQSWVKITQG